MLVTHLDYTSDKQKLRQTAALATPLAGATPIARNAISAPTTRQPTSHIRVDALHRRITERHIYDKEITDRCTSARRNTGCIAQWQQNRRVRLREYQL